MGNLNVDVFNPFPAKPFTLLMLFSSKSGLKKMLKRPKYSSLELNFASECTKSWNLHRKLLVSIQHPIAVYKLHTVYFVTYLI